MYWRLISLEEVIQIEENSFGTAFQKNILLRIYFLNLMPKESFAT